MKLMRCKKKKLQGTNKLSMKSMDLIGKGWRGGRVGFQPKVKDV